MPNGNKYKMETQIKERTRNQDQKYAFYFCKNKIKSDNAKIFMEVKFNKMQIDNGQLPKFLTHLPKKMSRD